jgi:hypothetical protein
MSLTGFLSYSCVNWKQLPDKSTPLSAANLNAMDAGIKNNNDMISNLRGEVTQLNNNILDTGKYGVIVNFTSQKYNGYVRAPINFKIKSNKYTIKLISALRLGDTYQYAEDIEVDSRYGCAVLLSTKEELIGACVLAELSIS